MLRQPAHGEPCRLRSQYAVPLPDSQTIATPQSVGNLTCGSPSPYFRRMSVRTRFPPSPTGALHIGSVRTALFNYLFARHHAGAFVLRIEDTDRERSTPESTATILDGLNWLKLEWDEGPFFQTQRTELYRAYADRLMATGRAYRCWCTADELEARRQAAIQSGGRAGYDRTCRERTAPPSGLASHVVRFKAPIDGETVVDDLVKGRVVFQNAELDDFVILRSDATAVYNFCVVVDDVDMRISHVIRGDDHLTNTPRQVLLYQALDATLPRFAHIPMILGADRAKLSKRHGAASVLEYREQGFLPDALVNYLARLGWSHGDQELFSRRELIESFSLENVGSSPAIFNPEKLAWVNFQYLKDTPPDVLARLAAPFLTAAGLAPTADAAWLGRALGTLRERAKTLVELVDAARFYVTDDIDMTPKAAALLRPEIAPVLDDLVQRLDHLDTWDAAKLESVFQDTVAAHGIGLGKLAQPVRAAVTGSTASPGIYEVLDVLGRERSLARLRRARARITSVSEPSAP
jgi:glutamyl-tRNA synthetase